MVVKFVLQEKLYRRESQKLVIDMIRHNTLRNRFRKQSNSQIIKNYNAFAKAIGAKSFDEFVLFCRDYNNSAPFENLADGGKWYSDGTSNLAVTNSIGEIYSIGDGAGEIALNPYIGAFTDSFNLFKLSLNDNHYANFKASLAEGIAAIESFIREQANLYNFANPHEKLIDDKHHKVSFSDKIDLWLQKMTGAKLDKGTQKWASFVQLNGFRDNFHIHIKGGYGVNYKTLLDMMNKYKHAIPGVLMKMHTMFDMYIPSNIIRAKYFPEISLIVESDLKNAGEY